jgi:chromosome partitioning protein
MVTRPQSPGPRSWKLLEERPGPQPECRVVCVANQKGGVGKTTTSTNLAAALALRGHSVLVADIDPQANATTGLGLDHRRVERSTYDLLSGQASLGDIVRPTATPGLDCAPANLDLAGAEIELVKQVARERKLGTMLRAARSRYRVVLLDCPPSLGLLTINALIAAHDLIVPVQCEYYALEGLGQLLTTAERVRRTLNPDLRIAGFLLTMYDARTKLSSQVAQEVRQHFGELVFRAVIPRSVRVSEAPSYGEPVVTLQPSSRGAISYRLLAGEVEARLGLVDSEESQESASSASGGRPEPPRAMAVAGPAGRGYGTVTPEPVGIDEAWPPRAPWGGGG